MKKVTVPETTTTTPSAHSKIGASSMYRWSACPASVRLSEGIVSPQSKYAEEGTKAHDIAANILLGKWGVRTPVEPETMEAVNVYTDLIFSETANIPKNCVLVEHRFSLEKVYKGLFGTADCVAFFPKEKILRVYDYKHGAGLLVEVENNSQLMYYGLGALLTCGFEPVEEIELVIVQPRCSQDSETVRRWKFKATDLLDFAFELEEFAKATEDPKAPVVPGEHCRFCPAAIKCPELTKQALAIAKDDFAELDNKDPHKVGEILSVIPSLEAWIKNVQEIAYNMALQGSTPKGYKLVAKRATRKWLGDQEQTLAYLCKNLHTTRDEVTETKVKSPAQIEKTFKGAAKLIESIVIAESSGTTLAPMGDKRPEVSRDIAADFDVIE